MRAITPFLIAILAATTLLCACSDDGAKAAKAKRLQEAQTALKEHNASRAELADEWGAVRGKVIPALLAWKRAKGTGDEASLKEALDEANAAAEGVQKEENAWKRKLHELQDTIKANGG